MPRPVVFCEYCGATAKFVDNPQRYIKWVHEVAKDVVRCQKHRRSSLDHYKCRTHKAESGDVVSERIGREDILYRVHELYCLFRSQGQVGGPGFNEMLKELLGYYGAWQEQHGIESS